jgi:hypothetical protein
MQHLRQALMLDLRHELEEEPHEPEEDDEPPRNPVIADVNQVVINLVSTGTAAAIALAVKKFLKRTPNSNVEVRGEARTPDTDTSSALHPYSNDV